MREANLKFGYFDNLKMKYLDKRNLKKYFQLPE